MKFKRERPFVNNIKITGLAEKIVKNLMSQMLIGRDKIDQNNDWTFIYASQEAAKVLGHADVAKQLEDLLDLMNDGSDDGQEILLDD